MSKAHTFAKLLSKAQHNYRRTWLEFFAQVCCTYYVTSVERLARSRHACNFTLLPAWNRTWLLRARTWRPGTMDVERGGGMLCGGDAKVGCPPPHHTRHTRSLSFPPHFSVSLSLERRGRKSKSLQSADPLTASAAGPRCTRGFDLLQANGRSERESSCLCGWRGCCRFPCVVLMCALRSVRFCL